MELSALQSEVKPIGIRFNNGILKAKLYAGKLTRKYRQALEAQAAEIQATVARGETPDRDASLIPAEMIVDLLQSWELTDQGAPCPLSVDFLADEVGYILCGAIIKGIIEAADPN